jgi:hypothetical protein
MRRGGSAIGSTHAADRHTKNLPQTRRRVLTISRKDFVATAALGAGIAALGKTTAAAPAASPVHFHVVAPSEYDRARMLRTIRTTKPHKQVFQSVAPLTLAGIASLYLHMQNALNAFEFSYGLGRGSLATLGILTGKSVTYGLNDAMWAKYGFGAAFDLAPTNVYYRAARLKETGNPDDPDSIYQDFSAQAVLARGGAFMVCHNALTVVAGLLGPKAGVKPDDALDDFMHNVLPGFQVVPAGVAATQLAQEHGWHNYALV